MARVTFEDMMNDTTVYKIVKHESWSDSRLGQYHSRENEFEVTFKEFLEWYDCVYLIINNDFYDCLSKWWYKNVTQDLTDSSKINSMKKLVTFVNKVLRLRTKYVSMYNVKTKWKLIEKDAE